MGWLFNWLVNGWTSWWLVVISFGRGFYDLVVVCSGLVGWSMVGNLTDRLGTN